MYETFIDITPYVNNKSITEYYGKYFLNVEIHGSDYRDKFVISEFYLQTDTFVEAGPTDTEGWITNPGLKDTDGDGWNDYKEIFLEGTNPLSADTDGDGAWDKFDRDPLQDVMLNISAVSGTTCNYLYRTPRLQMVIAFELFGTGESYYIPTLKVWAHADPNEYGEYQTAYFDGTHGSDTELHYYINVDDDVRIQSNVIAFTLQLWRYRKISWDTKIVSGKDYYKIGQVGYFETVNVTKFKDAGKNEAKFKVETIGVEKANTLAIYETNGTTFNGHYQELLMI